ncbi:hypothetical protein BC834DRAFT_826240 [Gloeopeniophorella convolvens]|nr:hypothetical protein BC834DRAFT_826240 [Gloeopeniophorella convolvens]
MSFPPGLLPSADHPSHSDGSHPSYTESSSGGDHEWLPFQHRKLYTNAFILSSGPPAKILLGYKKRGFGADLQLCIHLVAHSYNGFGGKVEPGESPAQAAARELKEECGVDAPLVHCGTLLFVTDGGPEWAFQIEIYRAEEYTGTLVETDEMRPQWFFTSAEPASGASPGLSTLPPIPYDRMWPDDIHWMPLLLENRPFVGRADFRTDSSGKYEMLRWWFGAPSA